jgi:hypothetical protein
MADHLSIEILGVLSGAADGPLAVGTLGVIALAMLALAVRGLGNGRRKALCLGLREECRNAPTHETDRPENRVSWPRQIP